MLDPKTFNKKKTQQSYDIRAFEKAFGRKTFCKSKIEETKAAQWVVDFSW